MRRRFEPAISVSAVPGASTEPSGVIEVDRSPTRFLLCYSIFYSYGSLQQSGEQCRVFNRRFKTLHFFKKKVPPILISFCVECVQYFMGSLIQYLSWLLPRPPPSTKVETSLSNVTLSKIVASGLERP